MKLRERIGLGLSAATVIATLVLLARVYLDAETIADRSASKRLSTVSESANGYRINRQRSHSNWTDDGVSFHSPADYRNPSRGPSSRSGAGGATAPSSAQSPTRLPHAVPVSTDRYLDLYSTDPYQEVIINTDEDNEENPSLARLLHLKIR